MIVPIVAGFILLIAVRLVLRGTDVRLVLACAALALGALAGDVTPALRTFLTTMSDEKFIVPICSAMGFAFVLRATGCDTAMVELLVRPLRSARGLLIPGVLLVGFLVNIPVISQTGAAVCIGSVVVPLLRAAGFTPITIGATLILGASIGGELLNPGAPELLTVAKELKMASGDLIPTLRPLLFVHFCVAGAVFWFLTARRERGRVSEVELPPAGRVSIVRALVPLIPLVFLFVTGPPFKLVEVPATWLTDATSADAMATRLIGFAMLLGCACAALAVPRSAKVTAKAFFDGAGYAYTHVISLIIVATAFAKSIEQLRLDRLMQEVIAAAPGLLPFAATLLPMAFAFVSGSGMAATRGLYAFFVEPARAHGYDPIWIGALVSIGSAAGRTMSPVAAVVLMSGTLAGAEPLALIRRVALPLLAGLAAMLAYALLIA